MDKELETVLKVLGDKIAWLELACEVKDARIKSLEEKLGVTDEKNEEKAPF